MIMVQKFHSIHEIDPEFIPNIEVLLQEEIPSFQTLIERHDSAPEGYVFTYFLFFGPTQNTPIGFAQICLKPIPSDHALPWYKKLCFWNKDHEHWKELTWKIGSGSSGLCVFDPKFSRSGKDKVQELISEYEKRDDIKSQELYCLKGLQDFKSTWSGEFDWSRESFILEPFQKSSKDYETYLSTLPQDMKSFVKSSWKELHKKEKISLGDYDNPLDTPQTIPIPMETLKQWKETGAQVLTFEKELKVLGCLVCHRGKNGNVFFEPFPFETEGEALVKDQLYTQYALLKFFEMPNARKCHLLKFGSKLSFNEREDLRFFESQGFNLKTVNHEFKTRLPGHKQPL